MPRPHRLPGSRILLALVAGLVTGACGGTLYDAEGVPRLDPAGCGVGTHACGGQCVPQDAAACGDACAVCTTQVADAAPACQPTGAGGAFQCGIACVNDTRLCGGQCLAQTVAACGDACLPCRGSPANGAAVCADLGAGAFACDYTCNPGFFKVNGGCARPTAVAAGQQHTCAVVEGGALLCWGANGSGQLGPDATGASSLAPRVVFTAGVTGVAAGARHTCAVVGPSRNVHCWGGNDLGQLGRGTTGADSATPAPVSGTLAAVGLLAAGANHTCALAAGAVRCWGANAAGQSGTGTATAFVAAPGAAALASGATAVAAGGGTTCASAAGGLLCWGNNNAGQAGRGTSGAALSPAPVTGLPAGGTVVAFAVGANHACAATGPTTGLSCWGDNATWQLGDGGASGAASSVPVPAFEIDNQARFDALVGAGGAFSCGTRSGEQPPSIKCGGQNAEQQAGPRLVPPPDPLRPELAARNDVTPGGAVLQLALGAAHGCALVDDVTAGIQVKCWGRNAEGQLGRPTAGSGSDGVAAPVPP